MAKDILKRAKSGEIQSIVAFGTDENGDTWNQFNVIRDAMTLIGESRLVERDLIDLNCETRKNVSWECCE